MYRLGHYGVALLAYVPLGVAVAVVGFETAAVVGALVCVALSTTPDLDHRVPLLEHRGPTHSVSFAALVGGALAAVAAVLVESASPLVDLGLVAFAFAVGSISILSHLLADAITPMGIRPFWPVSNRRYSAGLATARNPVANVVLFGLGVAAAVGAIAVVTAVG